MRLSWERRDRWGSTSRRARWWPIGTRVAGWSAWIRQLTSSCWPTQQAAPQPVLVALGPDSFSRPMPTAGAVAVVDLTRNRLLTFDLKGNQLQRWTCPLRLIRPRSCVVRTAGSTSPRSDGHRCSERRGRHGDRSLDHAGPRGGRTAGYEVVAGPAGGTSTVTGTTRQFTGLDPASAYTFSVQPVTHEQGRNGGPTTRGAPGTGRRRGGRGQAHSADHLDHHPRRRHASAGKRTAGDDDLDRRHMTSTTTHGDDPRVRLRRGALLRRTRPVVPEGVRADHGNGVDQQGGRVATDGKPSWTAARRTRAASPWHIRRRDDAVLGTVLRRTPSKRTT